MKAYCIKADWGHILVHTIRPYRSMVEEWARETWGDEVWEDFEGRGFSVVPINIEEI